MKNRFENKVAVITGGTSGIGRATAVAFAREGAKILLTGRREIGGGGTMQLVKEGGGEGVFVRGDARLEDDIRLVVDTALKKFGRLDLAFNNAGVEGAIGVPTHEQTEANFRHVIDINVLGVLLSMKYEI